MKREFIIFLIFSIVVFTVIAFSFVIQNNRDKILIHLIVKEESETISALLMSLRKTYQDAFNDSHIEINEKTINLLPVKITKALACNFSNIINNNTTIRTVSNRPRNPNNKANKYENKIISFFNNNPKQKSFFTNYDSVFYYAIPLYIEQSCLKCHGKQENAIPIIRDNYNKSYNYKVGELRGILSINMTKKSVKQKLISNFNNRLISAIILFLLIIFSGYFAIRVIVKNKKVLFDELQLILDGKTSELYSINKNLNNKSYAELNKELINNIDSFISTKKNLEEKEKILKYNNKNFTQLLNTFSDGLYINDEEYNITYLNEPLSNKLGKNKIGEKCYKAIYNLEKKCSWCVYEELKTKINIEYEHKFKDKYYNVRNVILDDKSKLTVFYDITHNKKIEKALKDSEEKFRKITNSSNDAIILIDNNEKIAMWNIAAYRIFGYSEEEVLGKNLHDILPPMKHRDKAHSAFALFRKSGKGNIINRKVELIGLKKDGTTFPLELSLSAIKIDNKWNAAGMVRDITVRKEYEKAFADSKNKIEEVHKQLTDNINYALTIQQALLTSRDVINTYLSEHFVLYKPKDKVSGDFYYINKFDNNVVFAAADCTGHGVSGAFLTMLGIVYLHDIASRKEINEPNVVLNFLRKKIKDTFKTFGSENNNGLDIALCVLDTETNILNYSGAYNPLWMIRNNELIEYKATRNPIGYYIKEVDFKSHEIQLKKNDVIYIFSDGYPDQMGGKRNKKFMIKKFKELLLKINHLPLKEQNIVLENTLNEWKGKNDQTDDIVVIGIRI